MQTHAGFALVLGSLLVAGNAFAQGAPPDAPPPAEAPPPAAPPGAVPPPPPANPPPEAAPQQPPPANYQQPPPGAYQGPAAGPYEPPPPAPTTDDPTARYHDGFYFRGSLGGGALSAKGEIEGTNVDYEINGGSFSLDLMFGGTPTGGLVIGGAYFFSQAQKPNVKVGSIEGESNNNFNFGLIGPFVDWFFIPDGGFHAGLIFGGALANVTSSDGRESSTATGAGGGLFLGYDFWIADQWSLGVLARATGGSVTNDDVDPKEKLSVGNFALMFSALYH